MRPLVEELGERVGDEHLPPRRADGVGELGEHRGGEAVRRDDDGATGEVVEVGGFVLAELGPGTRGVQRQPPHPARRVDGAVGRMEQRSGVEPIERRGQLVEPLDREPVLAERVVLAAQRLPLLRIERESQAARATERVPGEQLEPLERALGERHQPLCGVPAERGAGGVVRLRSAAKREPAVATAGAAGDLALLEQPDRDSLLGERQRAGAARDTASDHDHVRRLVVHAARELGPVVFEPI